MFKEIPTHVEYLIGYVEDYEFYCSDSSITLHTAREILRNLETAKPKNSKKEYTIIKKVTNYTEI